jgi:ligand-binding sensor domain-containing protein
MLTTLVGFRTSAEMADYLIDVWTSEHGLPNSSVTAIAQTPDGYLWVGTYNGLARFDGVRFVRFDPDNTPALQRARVRRLYVDSAGTLWINTYDGSLTSYRDGRFATEWKGDGSADATVRLVSTRSNRPVFLLHTGELIRHRPRAAGTNCWERLRPPGASSGQICAEDGDGVIWGRGRDQRLWRLVGDTFEAVSTNSGLQSRLINAITADAQGRLWVGTERELAVWEAGCFVPMTPTNGEAILKVAYLHLTKGGDAWVLANDRVRRARDREWKFEAEDCRRVFTGWPWRRTLHPVPLQRYFDGRPHQSRVEWQLHSTGDVDESSGVDCADGIGARGAAGGSGRPCVHDGWCFSNQSHVG